MEAVEFAMSELTICLLRVVRGAGRPESLADHVAAAARAFEHHEAVTGQKADPKQLAVALRRWSAPLSSEHEWTDRVIAEHEIGRASCRERV